MGVVSRELGKSHALGLFLNTSVCGLPRLCRQKAKTVVVLRFYPTYQLATCGAAAFLHTGDFIKML